MNNENIFNFSNVNQKTYINEQERRKEFEIYRNKLLKNNAPELLFNNLDIIFNQQPDLLKDEKEFFDSLIYEKFQKYKCLQCDNIYERKNYLVKHLKKLHNKSVAKTFKCNVKDCGKEYLNVSTLKSHLKKHTNSLKCRFCGRTFSFETSK
jgi:uncharacterized Zn-finger protein